jgi:hypothetical protein
VFGSGVPPNRWRWRSPLARHHVPVDEALGVLSEIVGRLGPAFRYLNAKRVILLMHIRHDQFAFVGFAGCKDMPAQQIFIFS